MLDACAWEKCTLFDVNFHPSNMRADELRAGRLDLMARLYDKEAARERRRNFVRQYRRAAQAPVPR